jgi:hypothetical protein
MQTFTPAKMWLPGGFERREIEAVRKAVAAYDSNLDFAKNENTGQWCVFLKHGTMAGASRGDLPVLGFRDMPTPDQAVKKLYQSDAARHGKELLDDINRHNDDIHAGYAERTKNAEGELAEAFEWGMRTSNITPHKKVYIP